MATWIVHLRIADKLINTGIVPSRYKAEFALGSLAPDCGYGKKDSFGEFTPPPSVTHWAPDNCKIFCEYQKFYDTYLKEKEKNGDYYFYLGYYAHLITDVLWSSSIYMPTRLKYAELYAENPEFLNVIKKDWYGLDFAFLNKTPNFEPYLILKGVTEVKDYLPYYERGQLTAQIKYISSYYADNMKTVKLNQFEYLTESEIAQFIEIASELVELRILNN